MSHPRDTHRRFVFTGCSWDRENRRVALRYALDGIVFEETIAFDEALVRGETPDEAALRPYLRNLHLMGGINTYKTAMPPEIVVETGDLTEDEAAFWSDLYLHGLGEHLYVNDLPPERIVPFPADGVAPEPPDDGWTPDDRCLCLMGGGKDSVVTARALQRAGVEFDIFTLGNHPIYDEVCAALGGVRRVAAERALSPELFKLNAAGYYNGHVPFSAHLAFIALLAARLGGYRWIVLSNERSASIGNVTHRGLEVNHQHSKSLAFEAAFQSHVARHITSKARYFSLLRPYSELAIGGMFAHLAGRARGVFTSCNRNFRLYQDEGSVPRWCGRCPKCLFTFLMVGSFLGVEEMASIMGKDLLADEELLPLCRQLLGQEGIKPLECVGVPEEAVQALGLIWRQLGGPARPLLQALEADLAALPAFQEAASLDGRSLVLQYHDSDAPHCVPSGFLDMYPSLHPNVLLNDSLGRTVDAP